MPLDAGSRQSVTERNKTFKLVETTLPPVEYVNMFGSTMKPVMGLILSNLQESRDVAALRDALLPKLVSGELRLGRNPESGRNTA